MKKIISTVILFICFISCQKAIEIDRDTIKPKLVVNCKLSPDKDTIKLSLSESRDLLYDKNEFPIVEGATIVLFENNIKLGDFVFSDNLYQFVYTVKSGSTYRIEAVKLGFDAIQAETKVASINTAITMTGEKLEKGNIYIDLNMPDISDEANYYQAIMKWGDFTEDSAIINSPQYYEPWLNAYACSDDYIIEYPQNDLLSGSNCNDRFMFSDKSFENGNHTLKLSTPSNNYYYEQDGYKSRVIIEFSSLNYDFYNYLVTRSIFQNNFGNPFAEPVPVYNNIENGFGIFGSMSTYSDTLIFE